VAHLEAVRTDRLIPEHLKKGRSPINRRGLFATLPCRYGSARPRRLTVLTFYGFSFTEAFLVR